MNVSVFWGNGCSHCDHLIEYLENLRAEDSETIVLYSLEVCHDDENNALLDELAQITGVEAVPSMIIGDEAFLGYDPVIDEDILEAIEKNHSIDLLGELIHS